MNEEAAKNETTNAVLKEMIIGLTKITDERFGALKETLTRIELVGGTFSTKTELEEAKKDFNRTIEGIRNDMIQHNKDDKDAFKSLSDGQTSLNNTVKQWIGGLIVIAFFLPIIIPLIYHYVLHI